MKILCIKKSAKYDRNGFQKDCSDNSPESFLVTFLKLLISALLELRNFERSANIFILLKVFLINFPNKNLKNNNQ